MQTKLPIIKPAKIYPTTEYVLYFDGCSKGNPGPAGIGAVLYKNNEEVWGSCEFIGNKTNNESEYSALILGLEYVLDTGIKNLCVYGDSLLVINQINGKYKVKSQSLLTLFNKCKELISQFDYITFTHVYRNNNKRADELSNMALTNKTNVNNINLTNIII